MVAGVGADEEAPEVERAHTGGMCVPVLATTGRDATLLGSVLAAAGIFFSVLIFRRKSLRTENRLESVLSRESSFVLNNWAFMSVLGVVFCGTLFPVFSEWATGKQIIDLLVGVNRRRGCTLVLVTHDPALAAHADRVVTLRDGRVVSDE